MIAARKRLITAEQFLKMPDDGRHVELVRGRIEAMMMPAPRHGRFCFRTASILEEYARKSKAGRVITNDSAVITERNPDTVRGADVAFYSYKAAKGKLPKGYLSAPPELVFEVRSPSDRMSRIVKKIGEYLAVGVGVVCLLDPDSETITVFKGENPPRIFGKADTLDLSRVLPGARIPVVRFFEED